MHMIRLFIAVVMMVSIGGDISHASEKKAEGGGESSEYVKLDPLLLPIIDQDGVSQVLSMIVVIEVEDVFAADKVKAKRPKLKDAYIQDMYGVLHENMGLKNGVLQIGFIKRRLNHITDEVMNHEIETEVLLQVVQQRPI